MLGLGKTGAARLSQLIAKKKFPKAIEVIREELKRRKGNPNLRRQLADVLVMAGRPKEAVPTLLELADDLALKGAAGKAIALLKRAQRLGPGRKEVEEQLAYLIAQEKAPSKDPWQRAQATVSAPPPPKVDFSGSAPAFPGDLEDFSDADEGEAMERYPAPAEAVQEAEVGQQVAAAPEPVPVSPEAPPEEAPEAVAPGPEEEAFLDEVLGLIEDLCTGRTAAESAEMASVPVVQTALFPDFSADELVEVIRGLELRVFEPGEIIVTEGEPGASLFLLTTGSVRAYVRDQEGGSAAVRTLGEGDFFGEVSLLEGTPRTATVTAGGRCELLELDRLTLGSIAHKHPHVWSVVRAFYEERSRSDTEVAARTGPARHRAAGAS